jgi:hypothetical protein
MVSEHDEIAEAGTSWDSIGLSAWQKIVHNSEKSERDA